MAMHFLSPELGFLQIGDAMMAAPLLPALARGCHGCTYVFFFGEVSETVMKMVFARRSALGRVAEKMESVAAMEVVLFLLVRRESRQ